MSELHDAVRELARSAMPLIERDEREAGFSGAGRTYGMVAPNGAQFVVDANGDLCDWPVVGWKWEELRAYSVDQPGAAERRALERQIEEAEERICEMLRTLPPDERIGAMVAAVDYAFDRVSRRADPPATHYVERFVGWLRRLFIPSHPQSPEGST